MQQALDKEQAAEFINRTTKTIDRAIKENKLACQWINEPGGGKPKPFFELNELQRYVRDRDTPTVKGAIVEAKKDKNTVALGTSNKNLQIAIAYRIHEDPLIQYEILQRAADNKWLLTTKNLAAILQISPRSLLRKRYLPMQIEPQEILEIEENTGGRIDSQIDSWQKIEKKTREWGGFTFSRESADGKIWWKIDANNS